MPQAVLKTRVRRERVASLVGGAGIALIMASIFMTKGPAYDKAWIAIGITGLILAFTGGAFATTFESVRLARLIQDLPTQRIRSAHQGYVELGGVVRANGAMIRCTRCNTSCLWFQYYTDRNRDHRITPKDAPDVILDDGTGQCLIRPQGCELVTAGGDDGHVHLVAGDAVHVLGEFRTTGASPAPADDVPRPAASLRDRLESLKRDQERMAIFDRDKDGVVDQREWEAAVKAVRWRMAREPATAPAGADPSSIVVAPRANLDRRPFVIFIGTEAEALAAVGKQLFWRALVLLLLAGAVFGAIL